MKKYLFPFAIALAVFALASCNIKTKKSEDNSELTAEKWIQLFNGKDLHDWTVKIKGYEVGENYGNTFRVEDGLMRVSYDEYDTFDERYGHIFYKGEFSNYKIRVEYRIHGEQCPGAPGWAYRNSGIMVHGQTPESMDVDQDFPTSIEVQLLGSDSTIERTNLNVCTPGTNIVIDGELILDHCTNSTSDYFFGDDWITVEAEVRGNDVIHHIVNSDTVLTYHKPQLDERDSTFPKLIELNGGDIMLHKGTISLQSEGHPIDFRKVELLNLDN